MTLLKPKSANNRSDSGSFDLYSKFSGLISAKSLTRSASFHLPRRQNECLTYLGERFHVNASIRRHSWRFWRVSRRLALWSIGGRRFGRKVLLLDKGQSRGTLREESDVRETNTCFMRGEAQTNDCFVSVRRTDSRESLVSSIMTGLDLSQAITHLEVICTAGQTSRSVRSAHFRTKRNL